MIESDPSLTSSSIAADSPLEEHLWSLTRDRSIASCWQRVAPAGFELVIDVDGQVRHRRSVTSRQQSLADSVRWRTLMVARGWARA